MKIIKAIKTAFAATILLGTGSVLAAEGEVELKHQDWSFNGAFGTYDRAAMQRGFQVYKEVCAACHGLKYIAFRNLMEIGFSEAEAKAIAAEYTVPGAPDEFGDPTERAAGLSDYMPSPFANEQAAKASNNGAIPPDLSLVAKAREGGPDYLYSLLTGYEDPPEDFELGDGLNYNAVFPGHQIAMPQPLFDDFVTYANGPEASVDQMAKDVSHFLMWAAEPKLEARHQMGFKVMAFMLVLTILLYLINRKVWANVKKKH